MNTTRQDVEKWLEDTKEELGIDILSANDRTSGGTDYTAHIGGECVSVYDPWDVMVGKVQSYKNRDVDAIRDEIKRNEARNIELKKALEEAAGAE